MIWCGKHSLFPSKHLVLAAYIDWKSCFTYGRERHKNVTNLYHGKKKVKINLISSLVDLLHPKCFVLLQLCKHAPYFKVLGYLWKVYDSLKILVGIQKCLPPKFSYKKFTWYMGLTAVLVRNHNCCITAKETRCEKYFKVICLSMSSCFAQSFNSKIKRN